MLYKLLSNVGNFICNIDFKKKILLLDFVINCFYGYFTLLNVKLLGEYPTF